MAINKVVNKSTKSHGAMRNVLEYVLRDEKVKQGYVEISGPYSGKTINYNEVYQSWLAEKRLWDKDSGRMYAHNIISFHKDEQVTPEQVLEIGKKFAENFFPDHQYVISVHQDKDHLHCHIVTNSVSYIDGMKLHQTKRDLEHQKEYTNQLCLDRGLTIAEKGKRFDGTAIEEGEVIAWSKDKYNLLQNESKKSFVAACAIAVLESRENCTSKDEFFERMEDRGWHTIWTDKKKHITFQNENGDKVRDSNLEKSFHVEANKEALIHEFERQNEILRLAKLKSDRERERAEQLDKYYREVDAAITGTGIDNQAIGSNKEITEGISREGQDDTDAIIREVQVDLSDSRSQDRTIRDTENKSVSIDKQSRAREAERRLKEQQRTEIEKRAIRAHGRSRGYSRPEL